MKRFLLLALVLSPVYLLAQQVGLKIEVKGLCSKEPLIFAEILVEKDEQFVNGFATDFDGKSQINNLIPDEYNLTIKYVGYETLKTTVNVKPDRITLLEFELKEYDVIIGPPIMRIPIISLDRFGSNAPFTTDQILKLPVR